MRPSTLHKDKTLYWTIPVYNISGILMDADSSPAPSVAVRKNGSSTGTTATVTKRSATTGLYDCSYDPSGELEGEIWTFDETLYLNSGQAYFNSFTVTILDLERGTDGITGYATTTRLNTIENNLSGLILTIDDTLATTTRLNTIESNLSGLVSAVDDNLATTTKVNTIESNLSGLIGGISTSSISGYATTTQLNTVQSNLSGLLGNISLSGVEITAAVDLSAGALTDIGELLGNSTRGMVYHVKNVTYRTTIT